MAKSKQIDKLHIYELKGTAVINKNMFDESFIGCWSESGYSYLFFSRPNKIPLNTFLKQNKDLKFISEISMDYDKWEPADKIKELIVPPLRFIPAWKTNGNNFDKNSIILDPGVVFGAGTHSTTRKCLEILIKLMQSEKINNVIDIGTGTGILAISSAVMGANNVTAIDNNNLAVDTARENAAINNLSNKINFLEADASDYISREADLITANLVIWVLEKLFTNERKFKSRWYIVSGIKGSEIERFKKCINALPLKIVSHEVDDSWSTLLLEKENFV